MGKEEAGKVPAGVAPAFTSGFITQAGVPFADSPGASPTLLTTALEGYLTITGTKQRADRHTWAQINSPQPLTANPLEKRGPEIRQMTAQEKKICVLFALLFLMELDHVFSSIYHSQKEKQEKKANSKKMRQP